MTLADVGELSRKLQEIEVGQPKDPNPNPNPNPNPDPNPNPNPNQVGQPKEAIERREEIIIYRTYLEVP